MSRTDYVSRPVVAEAAGVTREELADPQTLDIDEARAKLASLMERIPTDERVLIVGLAGSGNWHSSPDWDGLRLKNRDIIVGLDADVAINPLVWDQAAGIMGKAESKMEVAEQLTGHVNLLAIPRVWDADAQEWDRKAGLDDWLAAGGDWSRIPDLLRELPERPEGDKPAGIQLADVDFKAGTTSRLETVDLPGGGTAKRRRVLAEAAFKVTEIVQHRELGPVKAGTEATLSGVVAYIERDGDQRTVRNGEFSGLPQKRLSPRVEPSELLFDALPEAGSAVVDDGPGVGRDVMKAWRTPVTPAAKVTEVLGSGLFEHEGRLGYLTSDGYWTPEGIDPSLRANLPQHYRVQMPVLEPKGPARDKQIRDAYADWMDAGAIIHAEQAGLWNLNSGMHLASSALGHHAAGGLLVFGTTQFGKSAYLKMQAGWNGREWFGPNKIRITGSQADMVGYVEYFNSGCQAIDDAVDSTLNSTGGGAGDFNESRKFVNGTLRTSYEGSKLYGKKRPDGKGGHIESYTMPHPERSFIASGENLERMQLEDSTINRSIAFTVNAETPLLAGFQEIVPMIDRLRASNALAILRAAVATHAFDVMSEGDRRDAERLEADPLYMSERGTTLRERFGHYAKMHANAAGDTLQELHPGMPSRKSHEHLGPAYAGLLALRRIAERAGVEHPEPTQEWRIQVLAELGAAWVNHTERYAKEATGAGAKGYLQAVAQMVAADQIAIGTRGLGMPENNIGATSECGGVFIQQRVVLPHLKRQFDGLNGPKLKAALGESIEDPRATFYLPNGKRTTGWLIRKAAWDEANGVTPEPPAEPEAPEVPAPAGPVPPAPTAPTRPEAPASSDLKAPELDFPDDAQMAEMMDRWSADVDEGDAFEGGWYEADWVDPADAAPAEVTAVYSFLAGQMQHNWVSMVADLEELATHLLPPEARQAARLGSEVPDATLSVAAAALAHSLRVAEALDPAGQLPGLIDAQSAYLEGEVDELCWRDEYLVGGQERETAVTRAARLLAELYQALTIVQGASDRLGLDLPPLMSELMSMDLMLEIEQQVRAECEKIPLPA